MKTFSLIMGSLLLISQIACNNNAKEPKTAENPVKVSDNGVNIIYSDTGKGDTTLLFVHGWAINRSYWSNQVSYFNKRYRVVTIDLPGFGQSGKNRNVWNTDAYGKDIDSVIAQLKLKNVVLIGHSMAGHIVLQGAINNPGNVIGTVGVDNFKSIVHTETPQDKKDYADAMAQLKQHFKQFAMQYFNDALFYKTTPDSIRKRILADVSKADSVIAVDAMEDDHFDEAKKLIESKKKLFLINSDYTPTDTISFKINHIPYELTFIHATGHFPMVEKPNDFNLALQKIIQQL